MLATSLVTTAACSWNLVSLERAFNENTTDFTLHVAANLSLHQTYVVRTAAFTKLGHGPFTQPLVFSMDPANMVTWDTVMMVIITASLQVDTLVNPHLPDMDLDQLTSQTWFIAFIGSVVFVLVLLFILVMMMMMMVMVVMIMMTM